MAWHTVHLDDVAPTPWQNGGGLTRVLAVWPGPSDWRWRISVAEVASSGPFSRLPAVQRHLAILSGAGVRLDFADRTLGLTPADAPLCFSGDDPVHGQLLAGPVQDLNLMLRRDGDAAISQMLRVCAPQQWDINTERVIAIYSAQELTEVQLDDDHQTLPARTLAWRVAAAGSTLRVTASVAFCMIFAAPP